MRPSTSLIVAEVQLARIGVFLGRHFQRRQLAVGRIEQEAALDVAIGADQHVDQAVAAGERRRAPDKSDVAEFVRAVDQQPPPQGQRHQQAAAAGRIEPLGQIARRARSSARRWAA